MVVNLSHVAGKHRSRLVTTPFGAMDAEVRVDDRGRASVWFVVTVEGTGAKDRFRETRVIQQALAWLNGIATEPERKEDASPMFDFEARDYLSGKLKEICDERLAFVMANRERLVEAWIAETGLRPSESVLCMEDGPDGNIRCWVEKKDGR